MKTLLKVELKFAFISQIPQPVGLGGTGVSPGPFPSLSEQVQKVPECLLPVRSSLGQSQRALFSFVPRDLSENTCCLCLLNLANGIILSSCIK